MRYLFIQFIKEFFSNFDSKDNPRADMYLPFWLLGFGVLLIVFGIFVGSNLFFHYIDMDITTTIMMIVLFLGVGILAIICWKNQTIHMISDTTFIYSTFLGNKKEYRFSEINRIRKNQDSVTLFINDEKVHIESVAILSDRLADKLNKVIERINNMNH